MQLCTGIDGVCPPMAKMSDFKDGTYNLVDVFHMREAMDELLNAQIQAANKQKIESLKR